MAIDGYIIYTDTTDIKKMTKNPGRHLIQAFSPGEVSPEENLEIGMQLAKEVLGN